MVTLTTDYGTFQGETEAEALRANRAAARQAKLVEAQRQCDSDTAYERARASGYCVMFDVLDQSKTICRLRMVGLGKDYSPRMTYDPTLNLSTLVVDQPEARATLKVGGRIEGVLWDGAGFHRAIFVQHEGELTCHSLGVAGDRVALTLCPNVRPEHFKLEEETL